ncbi:MAG: HEPN domain-containing protein [Calditrichaeota bacterium]|nr:MAG: HEPN domain-containing protein [Calditrichota bacterium]
MKFWNEELFFMQNREEVKEWLKKAEADFEGALQLARRRKNPLPDLICFHCQQAAEKYLKAFLVMNEVPFPKTHDLLLLLTLARGFEPRLELYRDLLDLLNPYSIQYRYPGEEATFEEAKNGLKAIKDFRKFVRELFPSELWD